MKIIDHLRKEEEYNSVVNNVGLSLIMLVVIVYLVEPNSLVCFMT